MRRMLSVLFTLMLGVSMLLPVTAAEGNAIYKGNAKQFIFQPGSEYSPTDLFPNFKDIMPGDSLTQAITVRNDASNQVKVKIYMRSLGAHPESKEFLSRLGLRVEKSADNAMAYMFDAAADETAQLTDWVLLGTLYSGGEVNLNVTLDVPVELDNRYSQQIGYLDWEFMIEEFPIEESDPVSPDTGDHFNLTLWISILMGAAVMFFILLLWRNKQEAQV